MQVLVDHSGYELRNTGDVAMLAASVDAIRANLPQATVRVLTTEPDRLARFVPGADPVEVAPDLPVIGSLAWSSVAAAWRYAYKFGRPWLGLPSRQRGRLSSALASAELVISSGGGFVNDQFISHALGVLSLLDAAQRRGIPTAMLGQGLGPLSNPWVTALCRRVLPRLDALGLREGETSPPLAARFGTPPSRTCVTGDDALRLAGAGMPALSGTALGVNVRMSAYARVGRRDTAVVRQALQRFLIDEAPPVVALPVAGYKKDTDSEAIEQIVHAADRRAPAADIFTPGELAQTVSGCRAVVTGSYHAGVFALARGIPVVGLSRSHYYDLKFQGLRGLFGNEAVQSVTLDDEAAEETLVSALHRAWRLDDSVRNQIAASAAEQAERRERFVRSFLTPFALAGTGTG